MWRDRGWKPALAQKFPINNREGNCKRMGKATEGEIPRLPLPLKHYPVNDDDDGDTTLLSQ